MDYSLQLDKLSSAQLADIIVEAARILKARSATEAHGSSPRNKTPQGDPCCEEADEGCWQTGEAQGESGSQGPVAPEGDSAAEAKPAPGANPAPGDSPTSGANPGVGSQQPGVSPRGPQPYSFTGSTGTRDRFSEGGPKEPSRPRKAPPGPPPPQLCPERKDELTCLVRKLFVIEKSEMEYGWVFALDLQVNFQMEDIGRNAKAMKYVLHPDRSNTVFGNLSSEDRVECEVFTRQAYDFLGDCSTVASRWLRRDQVVDREGLFRQRPPFAQFDDSFLPAFFRRVGGPKFKAPTPGSFEEFQRSHPQYTRTPPVSPPAKYPPRWPNCDTPCGSPPAKFPPRWPN